MIERYALMLLEWNRTINLTGAQTLMDIRRQIEDAQTLLELEWQDIGLVIDIGSGGGLPAVPLAVQLPTTRFTLLEANARKAAFLQHAAGSLGLRNVGVLVGRAETYGQQSAYRERFDRAISRAAARPPVLLELALPFVKTGGDLVAEVGEIDAAALSEASRLLGGGPPRLRPTPGGNLLLVAKLAQTPPTYPRRPGVPNRRPLS